MSMPLYAIRALDNLAHADGTFRMVAADQRQSLRLVLTADQAEAASDAELSRAKRDIVAALSPHCSGILLDPEYVAAQVIHSGELSGSTGLVITAEADGYVAVSDGIPAQLIPGWRVEYTRLLGATAVKILVQYSPSDPALTEMELDFASSVFETTREIGLACVLEVLIARDPSRSDRDTASAMIEAASLFSPDCDMYKTPFPVPAGCTAEETIAWCRKFTDACVAPWVLLSGGATWGTFVSQLEVACDGGASGFLAGRSIWQDSVALRDAGERHRHLADVAVRRLDQLSTIAAAHARPWRDAWKSGIGSAEPALGSWIVDSTQAFETDA